MYWRDGAGFWGGTAMTIGMLVFWALLIAGMVLLTRYVVRSTRSTSTSEPATAAPQSPTDILAERFARGEIDEREYQDRLTTLRASRPD